MTISQHISVFNKIYLGKFWCYIFERKIYFVTSTSWNESAQRNFATFVEKKECVDLQQLFIFFQLSQFLKNIFGTH